MGEEGIGNAPCHVGSFSGTDASDSHGQDGISVMRTSLFSLPDSRMTFHDAVDYAVTLGLDAIEPYPRSEFSVPDVEAALDLADYAASRGIGICCFSMGIDMVSGDTAAATENLKRYADVAAAMGSPYLHHTLCTPLSSSACRLPFKEVLRRAVKGAQEVYDYAEQLGVQCLYENQGFYFNGVQRFDDFLGELNRSAGIVADFGNSLFIGEEPEAFVARFAPLVRHVHVKDYLRKDSRWPSPGKGWYETRDGGYLRGTIIGHGTVNFIRMFSILHAVGYDGFYSMEYDGIEDAYQANVLGLANMKRYYEMAGFNAAK